MALECHNKHHQLHFLLVPYLCPGHLIPMVDIARLLVNHGAFVTLITTPLNATRIKSMVDTVNASKLPIQVVQFEIPVLEFGLPEGCESLELVPSRALIRNFMFALSKLQTPIEELIEKKKKIEATPISCILVDKFNYWMENVALKFQIPRLIFDGTSCMNLLVLHNLFKSKVYENVEESNPIVVPNLPHRIELTKSQLPLELNPEAKDLRDFDEKIRTSQESAYGVVINSFEELEFEYVKEYKKVKSNRVWCIGPVSLLSCNNDGQRGNKSKIDIDSCLKFLDSWPPKSVVYVCLGSLNNLALAQFQELALALESCNFPFIWVMKEDDALNLKKWLIESGFEERTKERGLMIHGWAPQVLIFSHNAIGVFLTHCGWNSTLEAICGGVPMITWPMFADQFFNEKLVVQILGVGEKLGNEIAIPLGKQENYGANVKRERIVEAIEKVIGDGDGEKNKKKEERRESVRKLAELAKESMEVGGSSYLNMKMLLEDMERVTQ